MSLSPTLTHLDLQNGLTEAQALALAQFAKRVTWSEIRGCAVDDSEAYLIRDAIDELRSALGEAGYAPR